MSIIDIDWKEELVHDEHIADAICPTLNLNTHSSLNKTLLECN